MNHKPYSNLMNKLCQLISLCLLLTHLSACSTVNERQLPKVSAQRILVLPTLINHKELGQLDIDFSSELAKALQDKGFKTLRISDELYKSAQNIAYERSGSVYDPELGEFRPMNMPAYSKEMMVLLAKRKSFDLVLFPSVVTRRITLDTNNGKGELDGLDVQLAHDDQVSEPVYPDSIRGLSLKILGITRQSQGIRVVFSGISLPLQLSEEAGEPKLVLKTPLLNSKAIKQASKYAVKQLTKQVER